MRQADRSTRRARASRPAAVVVLLAVAGLLLSACSDGHHEVRAIPAAGWPVYGGHGDNANYTPVTAPGGLSLKWQRPTGGPITAPLTLNANGDVGVTARTTNGCNLFVFSNTNGRKNFCKRMADGNQFNAMAFDQYSQPYVGESGMFLAFNGGGAIRWRMPTIGLPFSAKFAGPGQVLSVTQLGQILLIDAQTNRFDAPEVRLRPNADPAQPLFGLGDCISGGPLCAVSAPPAVDAGHERFYLNYRPDGAPAAQLTAMSYAEGRDGRRITGVWNAPVPGGMVGPATVSPNGETVYAFGRDGKLYAFAAGDGRQRWSYDLGGYGFATLSVSPGGVLIPTGTIGAPLTILKDDGDKAELRAKRDDVQAVSLATQTGKDTAWTVVRTGPAQKLVLTEFSTADGATKRSLDLPEATGFTTGVAVSSYGRIAVATNLGEVYYFA
ncbi:PQQ-binding-like beta-propeller repeat protein [Gordonia sp. (in: high G+C Gram-positive bacteria)]|uniref:outer membrane protein assembly factor BamB family protein n=1 Tax=Gordonia sp. (in: high G+C Gram-positive bacteria) TaxID=84139 RepID=UPI0035290AEE